MSHAHKCGHDPRGDLHGQGCGYVWRHGEASINNKARHTCPNCGSGPFWSHYRPAEPMARPAQAGPGAIVITFFI